MNPEDFRSAAGQHADWIAEYFTHVRGNPVLPAIEPGSIREALPAAAPECGESIEKIFAEFQSKIFPGLTLWNHPRFLAFYPSMATPPSVLADFLVGALNVNAMMWKASPAATELEQVTLGWLRQWLELDESFFGIIYDTASISTLHALIAAREYVAPETRTEGLQGDLIIYISEHTHSSAEKAAIALGFGQANVRRIPVDGEFRMRPELLAKTIEDDLAAGKRPCCIVASVGSTSTSAIEPIPAIADIAEKYGIWLHVDAAYGGSAAVVPEMHHVLVGVERAHSVVVNAHKWLYVSVDCSVLYTRFPAIFRHASSLSAVYLESSGDERIVNYMDYGVQLGRRFRALKLWYVFRYYGHEGIIAMLRESLRLAQLFKQFVEDDENFEIAAPVPLSLVCFRYNADNAFNQNLLAQVNASGRAFLSQTMLNGKFTLRCAIGNFQTNEQDIREVWELIRDTAQQLNASEAAMSVRG